MTGHLRELASSGDTKRGSNAMKEGCKFACGPWLPKVFSLPQLSDLGDAARLRLPEHRGPRLEGGNLFRPRPRFDPDTGERIVTAEEDPRRATCPHSCRRAWKMRSPAGAFTGAVTWIVPAPTVTFRGASSAVAHHQPPAVRPPLLVAQYTPR